jgi:beta-lactamase class D
MKAARALAVVLAAARTAAPAGAASLEERPELAAVLARREVAGTFVLYDVAADRLLAADAARAQRRFRPASTFKIVNSLIALETGAVRDENEVIPYGGKPQPFPHWEKDMAMREAIRASSVPVYQEIARRIGAPRMRAQLSRLGYGNGAVGPAVDRFWLDGSLQISAIEQALFLARLARGRLPLSARAQTIVRDIVRLEPAGDAALYGKTGFIPYDGKSLGWWVGWVERGGKLHTFALNLDLRSFDEAPLRVAIGRELLAAAGVLPAPGDRRYFGRTVPSSVNAPLASCQARSTIGSTKKLRNARARAGSFPANSFSKRSRRTRCLVSSSVAPSSAAARAWDRTDSRSGMSFQA